MLVPRPAIPLSVGGLAGALSLVAAVTGLFDLSIYDPVVAPNMMPGTVSQDLVSLAVGAAIMVLSYLLYRRDGVLWLIWLGGIAYLAYAYAIYAFEAVMTPLFLLYVACFGSAIWGAITFFTRLDVGALSVSHPPRRLTAALFGLLVLMFLFLWLSILVPASLNGTRQEGNTIFVLDLAFVLPLLVVAGGLLMAARPLGDLLAIPLLIKASSLGVSVLLGTLIAPLFGFPAPVPEIVTYAILGLVPLALIPAWLRALRIA